MVAPPVLVGLTLMRTGGAPSHYCIVNASAFLTAVALVLLPSSARRFVRRNIAELAFVALLIVLCTLLSEGIEGVRRWVMLGPVRLQPSATLSPLIVLGVVRAACERRSGLALGLVLALQGVHLVQPDAGQSSTVAIAIGVASVVSSPAPRSLRLMMSAIAALACAVTWTRPDPLAPVHFVEDAMTLAFSLGWSYGIAGVVALWLPLAGPWLLAWRIRHRRSVAPEAAMGAYMAGCLLVVWAGNFPLPLLGFGGSPVLGITIGFVVLTFLYTETDTSSPAQVAAPSKAA